MKIGTMTLALILAALLGACGEEPSPEPSAARDVSDSNPDSSADSKGDVDPAEKVDSGPKVIFLGDSITAGLHLESGKSRAFPAVLERRMRAAGLPMTAVNAGVSGDTSAGGLRRLDWLLKQKPDLIVLELGGNDALRGQPLDAIEKNLGTLVDRIRGAGVEVMLVGMLLPPSYGESYSEGFEAIYAGLGEREGVRHVPDFMLGVGGVPELNFPDLLHPNAAGHEKLADRLEEPLRAWLSNRAAQGR